MTTRLLLVRHGRTSYNAEIRFMGQLDIPLDETGGAQVRAVARRLANETPAVIYCSNLGRARDTALAIQSEMAARPPLRVDERLTEGHFGDWQGRRYEDLRLEDGYNLRRWEADRLGVPPPNGEALADLGSRVQEVYEEICAANQDETVVIAAHGGSLQVLIVLALGLPLERYWQFHVSYASLSELQIYGSEVVLHLLNDTSHLEGIR
jgi:broad specificity phosphatase PhoE